MGHVVKGLQGCDCFGNTFGRNGTLKKDVGQQTARKVSKQGADVRRYRTDSQGELRKLGRQMPIGKARMSTEQLVTIVIRIASVFKIMKKIQVSLSQLAHQPSN